VVSIGDRVQVHPATDTWMRGDRYGEVVGLVRCDRVKVLLDRSGRTLVFHVSNILEVI